MISFTLPLRLVSLANVREHWARRAPRGAEQRFVTRISVLAQGRSVRSELARGSLRVTITRSGPRRLDSDNLAISAKYVRDGVADALGVDDGDPRLSWIYAQQRGPWAVRVEIDRDEH